MPCWRGSVVACTIDHSQRCDVVTNTKQGWSLATESTATARWHSSCIQKRLARVFLCPESSLIDWDWPPVSLHFAHWRLEHRFPRCLPNHGSCSRGEGPYRPTLVDHDAQIAADRPEGARMGVGGGDSCCAVAATAMAQPSRCPVSRSSCRFTIDHSQIQAAAAGFHVVSSLQSLRRTEASAAMVTESQSGHSRRRYTSASHHDCPGWCVSAKRRVLSRVYIHFRTTGPGVPLRQDQDQDYLETQRRSGQR